MSLAYAILLGRTARSAYSDGVQVEKLRQAGVELLGILNTSIEPAISSRANALFVGLLDIIAALDSQVSRELASSLVA